MDRVIQSPGKYIQGADVLSRLGDYLKPLANRWLVVGDKFVLGFAEETLRQSFKKAGLHAEIAPFGGECSQNEIDRLKKLADSADCLAVLGIGGVTPDQVYAALLVADQYGQRFLQEWE